MAQNDYFVIVYQVLKYLYDCLKAGVKPDPCRLSASVYSIPESYWHYIVVNLLDDGYICGIAKQKTLHEGWVFGNFQNATITPKGIEYLFENSLLEKAKRTLKDIKDVVPCI